MAPASGSAPREKPCRAGARWPANEKVSIVEETYLPDHSVSIVARRHGISANQLFTWRRLTVQGAFTAAGAGEEVVPASEYRAAQQQIRELQRLLGKKTLENEILREAVERRVSQVAYIISAVLPLLRVFRFDSIQACRFQVTAIASR